MPKQKTKKSAAKRFKLTATGKVKFRHPGTGHLLTGKTTKRKRHLRARGILSPPEQKRIAAMLG